MSKKSEIKFTLRLSPELHEYLVQAAESATPARSLNSEILMRLEASRGLERDSRDASKRLVEIADEIQMVMGVTVAELVERIASLEESMGLKKKKDVKDNG